MLGGAVKYELRCGVNRGKGGELCARDLREGERKAGGLRRSWWCSWQGLWCVGLKRLRREQDNTVLGYWHGHECYIDGTQEGRRVIRAAADAPCLDSSPRIRDWRGGGTTMRGYICKGRRGEMNFASVAR